MRGLTTALCVLMLAVSPLALAQDKAAARSVIGGHSRLDRRRAACA